MDYQIAVNTVWRYRDKKRGAQELRPGVYRVPEDITDELATKAKEQGVAYTCMVKTDRPVNTEQPVPVVRRRGRPRKSLGLAPENKSALA